MTAVDREQVRRVARLARLELSDQEVDRLAEEMGRVLSRFSELEALEEGEDAPAGEGEEDEPVGAASSGGGAESSLRPDRPDPDRLARGPDEMAPAWEDGFFVVPRLPRLGRGDGESPPEGEEVPPEAGEDGAP